MIDRLPGVRMTGENSNLVGRFERLLQELPERMILGKGPAWHHHPIPQESFSCAAQNLLTTFNPPPLVAAKNAEDDAGDEEAEMRRLLESDEKTILGFKEFRFFGGPNNNLTQVQIQELASNKTETLKRLFPCSRFVVNFRSDVESQLTSQMTRFHFPNTTNSLKKLQLDNALLHAFYKSMGPEQSILLDSTIWTRNISAFNEMVDWLGFSKHCHFEAALEYNTQNGYKATKTEASLSQDCKSLDY
jgi:hypothetical protein